ncbi:hypothetical protein DSECCO2_528280 [anaerobic digester metagenome]
MFEKASWEANPIMAAKIPAPANKVMPTERSSGMMANIRVVANVNTVKLTVLRRNLYLVGSTLSTLLECSK